jgi:hypothetical protein
VCAPGRRRSPRLRMEAMRSRTPGSRDGAASAGVERLRHERRRVASVGRSTRSLRVVARAPCPSRTSVDRSTEASRQPFREDRSPADFHSLDRRILPRRFPSPSYTVSSRLPPPSDLRGSPAATNHIGRRRANHRPRVDVGRRIIPRQHARKQDRHFNLVELDAAKIRRAVEPHILGPGAVVLLRADQVDECAACERRFKSCLADKSTGLSRSFRFHVRGSVAQRR